MRLGLRPHLLQQASVEALNMLAEQLAEQMRVRTQRETGIVALDLADRMEQRTYRFPGMEREGRLFEDEYKRLVEEMILELAATHPTVAALERGEAISDQQLIALERTLREELGGLRLDRNAIRQLWEVEADGFVGFMQEVLALPDVPGYGVVVQRQFEQWMAAHPFNADQIRFLRTVASTLAKRRRLDAADLLRAPFTHFGADAAERLFTKEELREVLNFSQSLSVA